MPRYEEIEDLPEHLRNAMPEEALQIYLDTYNNAWDDYEGEQGGELGQDAVSHRDAMTAVYQDFEEDQETGDWYPKEELEEEEEDRALFEHLEE